MMAYDFSKKKINQFLEQLEINTKSFEFGHTNNEMKSRIVLFRGEANSILPIHFF